ncbi:ribose 5-phosphate isomerase B [Candidatus Parcubacteria bacterium]|nr:ribose 5-phosphate isomerase B [Candidatus Parcubacteria bacterium]
MRKQSVSRRGPAANIVALGADHNGVKLKTEIKALLASLGYQCVDAGSYSETEKVDYADYARTVGQLVNSGEASRGVLVCGTGVGMSMVANRFPNVRVALARSPEVARKGREHNDANVLCLGAWVNPVRTNLAIVRAWFGERFGEDRHIRRVAKFTEPRREKVVFTNGIFDLLHSGHVHLLKCAKALGGKLIVGINSDRSTRILKGPTRPVCGEQDRKKLIESLGFVDQAIIFDDTATLPLIKQIKPDVVVKGGEWTAAEVRRRDKIPPEIEVRVFPLLAGYSTTNMVKTITGRNRAA